MWLVICIVYDDDYKHCEEPATLKAVQGFETQAAARAHVSQAMRDVITTRARPGDWELQGKKPGDPLTDEEVRAFADDLLKAYHYDGVTTKWHVLEVCA